MAPSRLQVILLPLLSCWLLAALEARAQGAPMLTPERQLTGAQLPPTSINRLSAAFDGTNFLLVWSDVRGGTPDIYGARLSPSGELLEPGAFPIATAPNEQLSPDVAFNGATFLVTWSDHRSGDAWSIYAARVSTTGTVLSSGLLLSLGLFGAEKYTPAVACPGAECLVIWSERRATSSWDIMGVTVDANGVVTSGGDQVISGVGQGQFVPELTREGTSYFAAWSDQRDAPDYGIYGTSINRSGQPGGNSGTGLGLKVSNTAERPALLWDGTNTWVAWTNTLLTPSAPSIHLRSLQAPGGLVTSGEFTRRPALAFDGTSLWLAYESELSTGEHRVVAKRFTRAGQAVDAAPFLLSGTDPGASAPHLASDGQGHVLVAYASHDPTVPHDTLDRLFYRVAATALPPGAVCTGDAECASGTCADGRCCDRRCDQACETCLRAEGASADGVCGPVSPRVCRAAASSCDVEERCDGKAAACPEDVVARDDTRCGTDLVCRAGACQPTAPRFRGNLRAYATCGAAAEYQQKDDPSVIGAGPYSFSVEQGPPGLTVDPATGALQWIPSRSEVGSHTAQLRVTTPGGTAVEPLSINVECPEQLDLQVACGCSGAQGGSLLLVLPGLLLWARRRRVSPRCCEGSRRSG